MSQNHTSNLDKVFLHVPPSSDFELDARILQIGWFYRPKWKKVEKSASKNKHPIKLRFLIWRLQSANPEKKVIPENQRFGSCPLQKNHTLELQKKVIGLIYRWKTRVFWKFIKKSPYSDFHFRCSKTPRHVTFLHFFRFFFPKSPLPAILCEFPLFSP